MNKVRLKRIADFLEKLAVAGVAVGVFQGNIMGLIAIPLFAISIYITKE